MDTTTVKEPQASRGPEGPLAAKARAVFDAAGGRVASIWHLPVDVVDQAASRLGMVAAFVVTVSLVAMAVFHGADALTNPSYPSAQQKWDLIGNAVIITVSLVACCLTRFKILRTATRLRVGLVYLVLIAFLVSLTDHADHFWQGGHRMHGVPWVTTLILVFPVLVPIPALPALGLGLVMAATSPLAMWTHVALLGYSRPEIGPLLDAFPFPFAFVSAYAARIVHRLGREMGEARQLGAYALEVKLGSGGMGEVWEASHRFLARRAAVKLIRPPKGTLHSTTALDRFEREAQATAGLKSPHTINVYDYGMSQDGRLYYVMELLEGVDLESLIEHHGPQPPERVVGWLLQVCHSLAEAHDQGLAHRDIKPANLYVCHYGRDYDFIKVLDFGLVSWGPSIQQANPELTTAGNLMGTPAYMPPEMALGRGPSDARSDVYSLGCVAHWLLTGQPVFQGTTLVEVLARHVDQAPEPPSKLAPHPIPEGLDRLVLKCLEKSPDARPQNADELGRMLGECGIAAGWSQQQARQWWEKWGQG